MFLCHKRNAFNRYIKYKNRSSFFLYTKYKSINVSFKSIEWQFILLFLCKQYIWIKWLLTWFISSIFRAPSCFIFLRCSNVYDQCLVIGVCVWVCYFIDFSFTLRFSGIFCMLCECFSMQIDWGEKCWLEFPLIFSHLNQWSKRGRKSKATLISRFAYYIFFSYINQTIAYSLVLLYLFQ